MKFSSFSCFFLFVSACVLRYHALADGPVAKTITVGQSGNVDFTTIQAAIDSVPDGNTQWIKISVAPGIYKEKVIISQAKQFIFLEGQGVNTTVIQWDSHVHSNSLRDVEPLDIGSWDTATFTVNADNFVARQITFQNTYDYKTQQDIAVAAAVGGDKSAFYDCKFLSYQDTLCDYKGRHYFSQCWIEGAVDFIWGRAASVYEGCTLNTIMGPTGTGWVTAHAKDGSGPAGYVFKSCSLTGAGRVYLGRAWNEFATVVFYDTSMADIVVPEGWDAWGKDTTNIMYAENGCTGLGSNTTNRVKWEKTLDDQSLNTFLSDAFIDADGWISKQPS